MSRLGRYRSRVMTRQRKHLILYMTAAAAFHAGAVTAGWMAWQLPEPPQVESPTPAQPIEFVYLDASETEAEAVALRRAQVSQKAAGEKVDALSANAGKSIEFQKDAMTLAGSKGTVLDDGTAAIAPSENQSEDQSEDQSEKNLPQPAAHASRPAASPASPVPAPRAIAPPSAPSAAPAPRPSTPAPATASPVPVAPPVATAPAAPTTPSDLPALSPAPFVPPEPIPAALPRPPLPPPQPLWEAALPPPPEFSPALPQPPQPLPEVSVARNPAAAPPPPGQGLDGIASPDRTTAASPPSLSAQRDPVWGEYVTRLNQDVQAVWQQVPIDRPYRVTVRLTLDRAGNLLDLQLAEPSGFADADAAAIAAVQQSAPFEPFPSTATRDRIRVNLTFNYNLVEQGTRARDPGARE
ncbi:MAG: TonB family protein [Cyanobacteriota bacterium]